MPWGVNSRMWFGFHKDTIFCIRLTAQSIAARKKVDYSIDGQRTISGYLCGRAALHVEDSVVETSSGTGRMEDKGSIAENSSARPGGTGKGFDATPLKFYNPDQRKKALSSAAAFRSGVRKCVCISNTGMRGALPERLTVATTRPEGA
jgi:hypothetical protein